MGVSSQAGGISRSTEGVPGVKGKLGARLEKVP